MATQSFYADNLHRNYPFQESYNNPIPKEVLVGFKIHCDYSTFFTRFPRAYVTSYIADVSNISLTFRITDGDSDNDVSTEIILDRTSEFQEVFYFDTNHGVTLTAVVGKLQRIPNQSFTDIAVPLEPTLLVWAQNRGINRIQIANQGRKRLTYGSSCIKNKWPDEIIQSDWWLQPYAESQAPNVIQDIPLFVYDGFNCTPLIAPNTRILSLVPVAAGGAGAVAEDLPLGRTLYGGVMLQETLVGDLLRYDGISPNTHNIYIFANAPGPNVRLESTKSVSIRAVQLEYTIYIDINTVGGNVC